MKIPSEFDDAVSKLFAHWDVLHHAVSSNFGGIHSQEKSEWLPTVVVDFFARNSDLEAHEVESFISDIMDNEFDLMVEDGSLKQLSKQLCRCFSLARDNRFGELTDFLTTLKPLPPLSAKKVENEDEDGSESESEEDEEKSEEKQNGDDEKDKGQNGKVSKPKNAPVIDEDGFQLVVGKKKH